MEELEETFLAFMAKGFDFLIPLSWVRDIQGFESVKDDYPALYWEELLGKIPEEQQDSYLIFLTHKNMTFSVAATEVSGLRQIQKDFVLELKKPVRTPKNLFLKAAVAHDDGRLVFILDPFILLQYVERDAG